MACAPFETLFDFMSRFTSTHRRQFLAQYAPKNMGGYMQPQGVMQLTVALASGMDPQAAIDQPRFCIMDGTHNGTAMIEDGVDENIISQLKKKGHKIETNVTGSARAMFGRAQIIARERGTGVLWAGSDGRLDGCAIGYYYRVDVKRRIFVSATMDICTYGLNPIECVKETPTIQYTIL